MGSYWALFTAFENGLVDFEAGSKAKLYSPVLVSCLIALVSMISVLTLGLLGYLIRPNPIDYFYGIPIGLLLAFGNNAYLRALASGPMGLISAVGGISVVVPVIYDMLIGKPLSLGGGCGVLIILVGVCLVATDANASKAATHVQLNALVLASLAAIAFGFSDILFKLGSPSTGLGLLLLIQLVEWVSFTLILAARRIDVRMRRRHLLVLLPLGVVNMMGWLAYSAAVSKGHVDIASALAYCSPIFTLLLAHFFVGELLSRKDLMAFCLIITGAWLVV